MNKWRKYLRLLLAYISFSSLSDIAYAASDTVPSTLNSLVPDSTPNFPSCDARDYYWYQKSGKDSVATSSVSESTAMIMRANSITGKNGGTSFASGNVEAYRDGNTINSDWLSYDEPTQHAVGGGNVILTKQYSVIEGKWIDYYMDLNSGIIKQANLRDSQDDMYADGDSIRLINKKQLQVNNGYMTTCDPSNPAWHITSDVTTFDYQDAQGNARNAKFYAESTELASFPYFQFPLGIRKSGFLTPEFGAMNSQFANGTANSAIFVGLPYYWNMAPNYDMTLEGKFYSTDGFMATDMFRYKNESGGGTMYTEQMPQDMATGQYRYYNSFIDNHTIYPNLNVGYNYNKVSDNNYFVNFGNFNSTVDNINLNQSVYANYTPQWGFLGVKMQGYQVLQPINQPPVSPIYAVTPQVSLDVKPQSIYAESGGILVGLHSQYSNFTSGALQNGMRSVIYPSLTYPIQNQWGFVKPKFGWNYTNYQLSPYPGVQNNYSSVDRNIPITSLDSGLTFERPITLGNSSYAQTLEPRLYYLYIPAVNQNNLPVFDTAPATYNINQLFSENRFVGDDRINMANDITVGLNSKLINDNTGVEFSNWGIGYRYFITPENNFLYGNTTQQAQLFLPQPNVIAELGNKWTQTLNSNLSFQYSTVYQTIDAYSAQARYSPEPFKVLNARFSYQYQMPLLYYAYTPGQLFAPVNYENQYALDISGQWPVYGNRWLVDGRANYDFTYGSILNFLGGLEYNGGCWNVKMLYENYITNVTQRADAFFLQFQLRGLADIGSDPTSDLRLNIPGYMPINNVPGFAPISSVH